jgi:hypothetical protein
MTIENRKLGSGWLEPESAANEEKQPVYPYNNVTETESGHLFELDDTPGRERIRLEHRTGTFIEMHPNGDEVHKVYGDGYEITIKDKNVLVKGDCSITIQGDCVVNIEGNKIERVKGNYELYVEGDYNHITKKNCIILAEKDMDLGAGASLLGAVTGVGEGALRFYSGDDMYVTGSLRVGGDIVADMVNARYSVDAGLGVTAGPLGFVSVFGGLSVGGLPVAVPGCVNATVMVNAPLGNFLIMTSVLMTDVINTLIYNTHIHPAPRGMTGTPIIGMI